jgi:hypothetical protein
MLSGRYLKQLLNALGFVKPSDLNLDAERDLQVDVKTMPALGTGDNVVGRVKVTDGTNVLAVPQAGDSIGRGVFILGSDYAATPAARIPKVDSSGNLYVRSV